MSHITLNQDEVLNNAMFKKEVAAKINILVQRRATRPLPKPCFKYKRDWIDRMQEKNMLNTAFFLSHIGNIWQKRSKLNAEARNVILYVCNEALQECVKQSKKHDIIKKGINQNMP